VTDRIVPVFKVVNGQLVRKEGDVRDPTRRYAQTSGPEGEYYREFTDDEERERDEEEARWAAEAPERAREAERQKTEAEAFRASLKYEQRLVAFIDILGWTQAVITSASDPEATRVLGLAVSLIRGQTQMTDWQAKSSGDGGWPGDPQATHFSDCLIVSTKADNAGKSQLISTLGFLAEGLLHHGFVLRGGLTVGDLYHQNSMVFGPALLKAHDLESRCAVYPRVILDPMLAKQWGQGDVYRFGDGTEIGRARTWRLSHDGFWFFDFIQPFGGGPDFVRIPALMAKTLVPLRSLVVRRLQSLKADHSVWQKYVWLANYFNEVCLESSADHGVQPIAAQDLSG